MGRPKKEIIPTKKCLHCGMDLEYKQFYRIHNISNIYVGNNNYLPVCKSCMKILFEQYRILYMNQFSVLGTDSEQSEEHEMDKLAIRRLCMIFDVYYNERLFDAALKQIENFPALDIVSAYMKIANLKQNKNKSYDDTILEENLSQELIRCSVVGKVREQFEYDRMYQDIYDLCLKLLQTLRKNCSVGIKNNAYSTND